jgi:hypothetical protein
MLSLPFLDLCQRLLTLCSLSLQVLESLLRSDNDQSSDPTIFSTIEGLPDLRHCFSKHSRPSRLCNLHPCRS